MKYIQYSVENNCHDAQLLLGDLLFEGKYIKQDIEKAVHLYKEVSCFNNSHAKNNLGVIYKNGIGNIEKRVFLAKEYFQEAIKKKNDHLSMLNLANIYLDEEESVTLKTDKKLFRNKAIHLLIESAFQENAISEFFLCLLLIKTIIHQKSFKKSFKCKI